MQLTMIWVMLAAAATVIAAPVDRDTLYNAQERAQNLMNSHNHARLAISSPSGLLESTYDRSAGAVNKRATVEVNAQAGLSRRATPIRRSQPTGDAKAAHMAAHPAVQFKPPPPRQTHPIGPARHR